MDRIVVTGCQQVHPAQKFDDISEALNLARTLPNVWVHIESNQLDKFLDKLFNFLNIPLEHLLHEQLIDPTERSKAFIENDHLFIFLQLFKEQRISFIIAPHAIITLASGAFPFLEKRCEKFFLHPDKLTCIDQVLWNLFDSWIEEQFIRIEEMDDTLEGLETDVIATPTPAIMGRIQQTRRKMTLLRQIVWPTREVLTTLMHLEHPLIKKAYQRRLNDLYDRTVQLIEALEGIRDIAASLLDVYISNINQRMNEVIKVLTVLATLFVPATCIASIYGMNFVHMPELNSTYGYPIVLGVMFLSSVGMLIFFRKRHWI